MTPKSTKMAPLGSQGAPWGRHGAHQVPQDRFGLQFGIPTDPKMDHNDSKMAQHVPNNASKKGGRRFAPPPKMGKGAARYAQGMMRADAG